MLSSSSVPPAVLSVVTALQEAGHRAFLVGGCVRDLLRGQSPRDFDVASAARPEQVQGLFRRVIATGVQHGTVTVLEKGARVEVTTFRAEGAYLDGRRPSSVDFHDDVTVDLSRRDFTMNAIAWDPLSGELVDPFGGQADLRARLIRAVREPMARFLEDGLRPLRAVRFATVLDFSIEASTAAAIPPTVHVFRRVAMERIQQEFDKLLRAPAVTKGLTLLQQTSLLAAFFPEAVDRDFEAVARAPADEAVRLAVLLLGTPQAREVVVRLKYPGRVAELVGALAAQPELPRGDASDAALRRWLSHLTAARAGPLLAVHRALGSAPAGLQARVEALLAAAPPLTSRELALDGKALMEALGTGPSPLVGQATRFLLEVELEDPSQNTPEGLRAALRGFPQGFPQSGA